jgi:UDP-2,4-diacetamido-2,4,6-trideoxy-beta-L-altropyranose hydrolase
MPRVVFRCDGGPSIGSGHVMRCLALASVFAADGWPVGFAVSAETAASVAALTRSGYEVLVLEGPAAEEPAELSRRWADGARILVVDHYGRDAAFERLCRPWTQRIVVLDDLADRSHEADVVVDAGNSAEAYGGLVSAGCTILSGPRYAIVHSSFVALRERSLARRDGRPVERVLVSFGQIDPPNATMRALDALRAARFGGDVDIVLGHAAPHLAAVREAAAGRARLHVDVDDMAAFMTAADLAIGAGGGTSWERCCLGLPTVLVEIAENQRHVVRRLVEAGACVNAGVVDEGVEVRMLTALHRLFDDPELRTRSARSAADMIDGCGSIRIVEAAASISTATNTYF